MEVELKPHPAQARHPVTNEPLWNDDGTKVPLVLDQKSIWLDGAMIGYCGLTVDKPISFIVPKSKLPPSVREIVIEKVANLLGGDWHDAKKISQVADIPKELIANDEADD